MYFECRTDLCQLAITPANIAIKFEYAPYLMENSGRLQPNKKVKYHYMCIKLDTNCYICRN